MKVCRLSPQKEGNIEGKNAGKKALKKRTIKKGGDLRELRGRGEEQKMAA